MDSSGSSIPLRNRRARRSRGVKIELLVSTRKRRPWVCRASMNSTAPGSAACSWTSTPSMSVIQEWTGSSSIAVAMAPFCPTAGPGSCARSGPSATSPPPGAERRAPPGGDARRRGAESDQPIQPISARSVAGELGAQRGQGLVGGQRALIGGAGLVRGSGCRLAPCARGARGLRLGGRGVGRLLVGPDRLEHLGLVGGLALVGSRVLGLPLLTLVLVALEPFVGLLIEALGVLVLAVLVVLGGHAVQGRIEIGRAHV